ncbi:hypothetical protein ElyMa_001190200 [Elysia marginata]|uniref:Uncharacterized protein n=1 Tax=Elysia marginata TaxID=1093978 RepID=A0AAV4I7F7_9GAST|nr:hypothetical protein ElyMa_001190200 [Elysia marginata]
MFQKRLSCVEAKLKENSNLKDFPKRLSCVEAKLEENSSLEDVPKRLSCVEAKLQDNPAVKSLSERLSGVEAKVQDTSSLKDVPKRLSDLETKVKDHSGLKSLSKRLSEVATELRDEYSKKMVKVETKMQKEDNELSRRLTYCETKIQEELSEKLNDVESKIQEELSKKLIDVETQMQDELSEQLTDVETKINNRLDRDLSEIHNTSELNSQKIKGLRKLQKLLKCKAEQNPQVTTATASCSASSQASTSAASTLPGHIQSLSQRLSFSVKVYPEAGVPLICDLKLLPGGLVLASDFYNSSVKLFNTQGHFIYTHILDGKPLRITVLNPKSTCGWDVAVTLKEKCHIALINVTQQKISLKKMVTTTKPCRAIAAVDQGTLAVGYLQSFGVDLIDLSGNVIRQLSSGMKPNYMDVSPNQHLVMSLTNDKVAKLKLDDSSIVYLHRLHNQRSLSGIACHHQDSSVIVDEEIRTLHLLNARGGWVKELWAHPIGAHAHDLLHAVSIQDNVCVCCTRKGTAFVLDVLY